jgi:hypothetical protein
LYKKIENIGFYNFTQCFLDNSSIFRNISFLGNGRKLQILELSIRTTKFFCYFTMSIHQSMQNFDANPLMCIIYGFYCLVSAISTNKYFSDFGSSQTTSKKIATSFFLKLMNIYDHWSKGNLVILRIKR